MQPLGKLQTAVSGTLAKVNSRVGEQHKESRDNRRVKVMQLVFKKGLRDDSAASHQTTGKAL